MLMANDDLTSSELEKLGSMTETKRRRAGLSLGVAAYTLLKSMSMRISIVAYKTLMLVCPCPNGTERYQLSLANGTFSFDE